MAQITSWGRTHTRRLLVELGSFYEKVVKVKADVAAILKFFPRQIAGVWSAADLLRVRILGGC
jgi:hypothetical protein